jgi:hypothetical protein
MFHPCRGGVRGGKDQFSWDDVKKDKDREYYLGHSLMAPVGKWQEGKDLHWYAKDGDRRKEMNDEFARAKELEEEALMAALGYKVVKKEKPPTEPEISERNIDYKEHKVHIKKEKDSDEHSTTRVASIQRPQFIDTTSKKKIDKLLTSLLEKYNRDEIILALGGGSESKSKKKSKKSKHSSRKSDSDSDSSDFAKSSSSSDEYKKSNKKRKRSSERGKRKKHKKHSSSSDSDSS